MNVCLLVDLFDELFGNETTLLLQLSIILEFFNSFHVLLVLVNPRPANCNSLIELGESSTFEISSRFPEACLKTSEFLNAQVFRSVTYGPFEVQVVLCEQFSSLFYVTTFTTHSSSVDWYTMMAWTLSAKILSCAADM